MYNFNNDILIGNDKSNLYLSFKVNSSKFGRVILLIMSVFMICFSFWLIFFLFDAKFTFQVFFAFCFMLGVNYLLIKYFLWNKYGEERLVISKKAVSFTYYYGFFETNIDSMLCSDIELFFDEVRKDKNDNSIGKLLIYSHNDVTGILELLHPTSVLISEVACRSIIEEVYSFLSDQDKTSVEFDGFSYN